MLEIFTLEAAIMIKRAIDLYSGIGGWTLGMKLSGIENVRSYEWWPEANTTHNINFNTEHGEVDIRKINVEKDLNFSNKIDFVVGSPPCTQFSYANKGGNGDIADGLVDVRKFLEVVKHINPKYWAMENVPRVANILSEELKDGGSLFEFRDLVKDIIIVDTSDFGVPQSRKRMIAGNFPTSLFQSYKQKITRKTLGDVLESLEGDIIVDPNFGYEILSENLTDNVKEPDLTPEEARINRDLKNFHPVYNNMSFPDRVDRPSRTITATCTRVSRESIIVGTGRGFRRLSVRERGIVQSFPITYQFYGKTLNSKFKMIGNAVPPLLTYYLFQSFLETDLNSLVEPGFSSYYHETPSLEPPTSKFDAAKLLYPEKRKFQYAIPNLRFGSGVRFELSNSIKEDIITWSFKFFFGNSKNIKSITLNKVLCETIYNKLDVGSKKKFDSIVKNCLSDTEDFSHNELQKLWTRKDTAIKAFEFIDTIGGFAKELIDELEVPNYPEIVTEILSFENEKTRNNGKAMLVGFLFLAKLNVILFDL